MIKRTYYSLFIIIQLFCLQTITKGESITPNDFKRGSDSDRIEQAIAAALKTGVNAIEIPRVNRERETAEWLIDRAILLPSDFTLILNDCLVRLSPGTQDNIITNAGARTNPLSPNKNIKIIGKGNAVLSGGLEAHFDPPGDKSGYRTIGILLYATERFTIEGFKMEETQAWAISVENGCAYGRIANIDFYSTNKYPNQDGVDIRKGCHDIAIENITGITGDDMIALTGLRRDEDWRTTTGRGMQIGGSGKRDNDDIYNITINNVTGTVAGGHHIVRLLNQDGIKMYNIFINNIVDTSKEGEKRNAAAIKIGDVRYWSIRKSELGETSRIFIDNVLSRAKSTIKIQGTLKDAVLKNIVAYDGNTHLIEYGEAPIKNVSIEANQL